MKTLYAFCLALLSFNIFFAQTITQSTSVNVPNEFITIKNGDTFNDKVLVVGHSTNTEEKKTNYFKLGDSQYENVPANLPGTQSSCYFAKFSGGYGIVAGYYDATNVTKNEFLSVLDQETGALSHMFYFLNTVVIYDSFVKENYLYIFADMRNTAEVYGTNEQLIASFNLTNERVTVLIKIDLSNETHVNSVNMGTTVQPGYKSLIYDEDFIYFPIITNVNYNASKIAKVDFATMNVTYSGYNDHTERDFSYPYRQQLGADRSNAAIQDLYMFTTYAGKYNAQTLEKDETWSDGITSVYNFLKTGGSFGNERAVRVATTEHFVIFVSTARGDLDWMHVMNRQTGNTILVKRLFLEGNNIYEREKMKVHNIEVTDYANDQIRLLIDYENPDGNFSFEGQALQTTSPGERIVATVDYQIPPIPEALQLVVSIPDYPNATVTHNGYGELIVDGVPQSALGAVTFQVSLLVPNGGGEVLNPSFQTFTKNFLDDEDDYFLSSIIVENFSTETFKVGAFWTLRIGSLSSHEISQKETQLMVYPNPATNSFSIKGAEDGKVEIVNMLGQMVTNTTYHKGSSVAVFHLPKGMYVVRYYNDKGQHKTFKLIKK